MPTRAERQPTTEPSAEVATEVATSVALVGLHKSFGDIEAVRGVDLEIRDGEFFSMLGPSGSGKTTVLRLVAGFEEPTAGRVLLGGRDVTRTPPFDRDVNTVFQDYALFPHMSVLQNVAYGLRVKGVRKAERNRRASEALDSVQLADYGDRKPSQLSGGQRQRIALARALVNRPRVLLLDEPLGALDLKLRQQMQIELKRIQREVGITFLFVTHDQDEALTMSDRLAVFNEGRVEQVGTPAEVYEHPASPFVAGFVGTANLLRGELARAVHGTDGVVSVRPERVRVVDADTDVGPDEVSADGVVREVVYAGALLRYVVDLDAGTSMIATQPNTSLSAAELAAWQGRRARLVWKREHALAVG